MHLFKLLHLESNLNVHTFLQPWIGIIMNNKCGLLEGMCEIIFVFLLQSVAFGFVYGVLDVNAWDVRMSQC